MLFGNEGTDEGNSDIDKRWRMGGFVCERGRATATPSSDAGAEGVRRLCGAVEGSTGEVGGDADIGLGESRKAEVALYLASLSAVMGRFCCRRFGGESRRGLDELADASVGIPAEVAGRNGTRSE